jgi:hypothetical protein
MVKHNYKHLLRDLYGHRSYSDANNVPSPSLRGCPSLITHEHVLVAPGNAGLEVKFQFDHIALR